VKGERFVKTLRVDPTPYVRASTEMHIEVPQRLILATLRAEERRERIWGALLRVMITALALQAVMIGALILSMRGGSASFSSVIWTSVTLLMNCLGIYGCRNSRLSASKEADWLWHQWDISKA
jgi:hypothetical protein